MARPREFEIDEAVAHAQEVFWRQGYEGASLADLLREMGIARGSLYKAFQDKRSLFLRVLRLYDGHTISGSVELLTDRSRPKGRARVAALFDAALDDVRAGDRRGCLLCQTAASSAVDDPEISQTVGEMMNRMRKGLLEATGDPALADQLLAHYVGLRVLIRSGAPLAMLEAGAQAALARI